MIKKYNSVPTSLWIDSLRLRSSGESESLWALTSNMLVNWSPSESDWGDFHAYKGALRGDYICSAILSDHQYFADLWKTHIGRNLAYKGLLLQTAASFTPQNRVCFCASFLNIFVSYHLSFSHTMLSYGATICWLTIVRVSKEFAQTSKMEESRCCFML